MVALGNYMEYTACMEKSIDTVRNGLRTLNRSAGVLKSDPYGIGLPLSHCSALIDIHRNESLKPNALTTLLHLDKSTVSRILLNLAAKNLIKVSSDSQDGRGKVITLTSKGYKLVDIINEVSNISIQNIFEKLTAQERQTVTQAFGLITRALESEKSQKSM
jgi:DNA-binding MarR family transcriptional regulator